MPPASAPTPTCPTQWSATENVAWKTDLPGRSWSSPIVWGDRVFLTAVVNSGESEAPKKGLYFGGERPEPSKAEHQWKVLCLDLATGKLAMGEDGSSRRAANAHPSQEQLRRGDARDRRRAGLRLVRQCGGVRLHARRRGGVVQTARAAQDALRLGHRGVAGLARRTLVHRQRQR